MTDSQKYRTYRLFNELRVDERFRAMVESLHKDRLPPRELLREMPPEQYDELMRRSDVYDGINSGLADHLDVTAQRLKTLGALLLVAHTHRRWADLARIAGVYLAVSAPEPTLGSTPRQRRGKAAAELAPDAGLDGVEVQVKSRIVLSQALDASPREWSWCDMQNHLRGLRQAVGLEDLPDDVELLNPVDEEGRCLSETIRHVTVTVYQRLRAIEETIAEANDVYFPGRDYASPRTRAELTRQLNELAQLYADAVCVLPTPPFELPEPGDEDFALMRHIMHAHHLSGAWKEEGGCSLCRRLTKGNTKGSLRR
jgi:hypothetical protein